MLLAIFFIFSSPASPQQTIADTTKTDARLLAQLNFQYQSKIGSKTIHRCPFQVSCSHFLNDSIRQHGALKGFALFLDRYFYRENTSISSNYALVIRDNKIVYNDAIPDSLIYYLYSN